MLIHNLKLFAHFVRGSLLAVASGSRGYYIWLLALGILIALGASAYGNQLTHGLITSHMRDQVSWGFYIGNFAFLVGVAAAPSFWSFPPTSTIGDRSATSS